jgi:hypothetical protein
MNLAAYGIKSAVDRTLFAAWRRENEHLDDRQVEQCLAWYRDTGSRCKTETEFRRKAIEVGDRIGVHDGAIETALDLLVAGPSIVEAAEANQGPQLLPEFARAYLAEDATPDVDNHARADRTDVPGTREHYRRLMAEDREAYERSKEANGKTPEQNYRALLEREEAATAAPTQGKYADRSAHFDPDQRVTFDVPDDGRTESPGIATSWSRDSAPGPARGSP